MKKLLSLILALMLLTMPALAMAEDSVGLIGGAVITVGLTVFFPQGVNLAAFTQLKFYLAAGITAVMAVLAFKKVHPIIIICISAVLGIFVYGI